MNTRAIFFNKHKSLIIKAIEELQFEELFTIEEINGSYKLRCSDEISYIFDGRISVWGNLQIQAASFKKIVSGEEVFEYTLADFFYETQDLTKMTDETLAQFIEEGNQTICGDMLQHKSLLELNLSEISGLNFKKVDQILTGHPKIIMNKGRIGWGKDELEKYAPEARQSYKLHWCAIKKDCLDFGFDLSKLSFTDILKDSLSDSEIVYAKNIIAKAGENFEDYLIVPIHPWQWSKYISIQFAALIYRRSIISIGRIGNDYTPQVSIRTLSSCCNKSKYDVKLAISILNTSSVRGIPQKYIKNGYLLSEKIEQVIIQDDLLSQKVGVLKEVAAVSCPAPEFNRITGGSYRYKELLGCVWRENVEAKIDEDEIAVPTAALLLTKSNESLIGKYIEQSKLSIEQWLKEYFKAVVIPLYHLQAEHGLGLVAHGQNTILVLREGIPQKLIIKDFHGDFRITTDSKHLDVDFGVELDQLPPEYLIHDLITGHFITLLRYLSRVVEETLSFKEVDFYHLMGEVVEAYEEEHIVNPKISLLRKDFEKVLVNSVRFQAGYSETGQRLKPMLGRNIKNPLLSNQTRGKNAKYL